MNFDTIIKKYLEDRLDHRDNKWSCWKCNCSECPFKVPCESHNGNPKSFYHIAIKEIERLN